MATLRNKRKLAAVSRETPENTRNNQSQNSLSLGIAEEYITQISKETDGRTTEELFQGFSRKKSGILGALSELDEFFLNPEVQACPAAVPGASRDNNSENREPTGDCSLKDPFPVVGVSTCNASNLTEPDQEESNLTHLSNCLGNVLKNIFFGIIFTQIRLTFTLQVTFNLGKTCRQKCLRFVILPTTTL